MNRVHVNGKWPLAYALACEKFTPENLPPAGRFYYHQGVFLSGIYETYRLIQAQTLFEYIKVWVNFIVNEYGDI